MARRYSTIFVLAITLAGCASTHVVRPLGQGNGMVNASLGGPFLNVFDANIPTPIVSLGGGYGVRDWLDVYGHVDVTALAFGVLHVDPGVAFHPVIREGGWVPTVTVAASLHLLTNFEDARGVPQFMAAAAWRIARRHLIYVGADLGLGFQPQGFRAIWGPFIGGEARVGKRVGLSLEVKWIDPEYPTRLAAPTWVAPGGQGYLSLLLGINVYIGSVK
jgi:hypothetical protein